MKVKVYTIKAEAKTDFNLPKKYTVNYSDALYKQATRVYEDRSHFGLAKVKTRAEVNKTKKKLYKQKGTGGARHGAKSAHIFVGGGVAHGPKGVKRILELPYKMRKKALDMILTSKFKNGEALLVSDLNKITKTSEANSFVKFLKIKLKINSKILVSLSQKNITRLRYFRNLDNTSAINFLNLSILNLVRHGLIIVDKDIFETKKEPRKK